MNKKQLITSLIVLVVLGLVSFFTFKKDSSSWKRGNEFDKRKLIEKLDVNKVARMVISNDSNSLEIQKDDKGKWVVKNRDDYPVDFSKLSDFILSLKEITVLHQPRILKDQFGSLKLERPDKGTKNPESGTVLALMDKDENKILSLIVGDQHFPKEKTNNFMEVKPDGAYVLLEGSDTPALVNDPLTIVDSDPTKWIDKSFIKIPDMLSMTLSGSDGKQKWKLYRKDLKSSWILDGLEKDDQPLPRPMYDATSSFSNLSFDDVSSAKDIELKDAETLKIETKKGIIYKFQLLTKDKKVFSKLSISANIQSSKIKVEGAKPEDMEKLKKEAESKMKALQKQMEKEFFYTQWLYEFPIFRIKKVLKERTDFYNPANI